jgi:cysteine desulfurase
MRIYMDHTAGKPVDDRVLKAMTPYFIESYGNPSSPHTFGNEARSAINQSRRKVAELISAEKGEEIVFTSGGTESNNLAIKGAAIRYRNKGNHIITSSIEHMSVLNSCKYLSTQGYEVTYLPVDKHGMIDPKVVEDEITNQTILVSIMYANGEIGTIEPIKEIGEITHNKDVIFHVDAVAAAGQIPINVQRENIDMLTISSNDMYGPRGVGALYVQTGSRVLPMLHGGGQEGGLRSGTENLPGIAGLGETARIAKDEMTLENKRLIKLRDAFIDDVLENIPESYLNGHPTRRLPNNINIRFSYVEGESLILSLDMEGVACSSGSACTSKTLEPSHALLAIGLPHEQAHGSLLFTLGKQNTEDEINHVKDILPRIVKRLRRISPLTPKELLG